MPRLLVFLPAEKVVIDSNDNSLAIFGILGGLNVPSSGELPEDAGAPMRWNVLAIWKREPSDEGVTYEQRVQLLAPSRRVVVNGFMEFRMTADTQRNRLRVDGFPVAERGEYTLTLSIREAGAETWTESATFPVVISHLIPERQAVNPEQPA
jgi:hypothetical protein